MLYWLYYVTPSTAIFPITPFFRQQRYWGGGGAIVVDCVEITGYHIVIESEQSVKSESINYILTWDITIYKYNRARVLLVK